MNALDVAIVVVGGFGVLSGLGRGVLRMATSIVALVVGIYFASLYYPAARQLTLRYIPVTPTLAAVIGYAIVFLLVVTIVQMAGGVLMRLVRTVNLGWVDRLAGGVVGGAIALALTGLALMLLTAALPSSNTVLRHSQLAPPVLRYTDALIAFIPPEVKVVYESKRAQLMRYWLHEELREEPSASPTPDR
jgi:membrane protein required for colicin V production